MEKSKKQGPAKKNKPLKEVPYFKVVNSLAQSLHDGDMSMAYKFIGDISYHLGELAAERSKERKAQNAKMMATVKSLANFKPS